MLRGLVLTVLALTVLALTVLVLKVRWESNGAGADGAAGCQ